jgi:hypothetical protein
MHQSAERTVVTTEINRPGYGSGFLSKGTDDAAIAATLLAYSRQLRTGALGGAAATTGALRQPTSSDDGSTCDTASARVTVPPAH